MQGVVEAINHSCGMVAVNVDGFFSIVELLGDEVEVGNHLRFDHYPLGGDWCEDLTSGQRIDVYFQNHDVPLPQLLQQLLYENGHQLVASQRLAQALTTA